MGACILLSIGAFVLSLLKKEALKPYSIISFSAIGLATLALIIYHSIKNIQGGVEDITSEALLYVFSLLLVAALIIFPVIFGKKTIVQNHTKSIVYAAVCIATSFALSFIRFFQMPKGGTVTFASLVPLMVYAYMFGSRKGLIACIIYGFLQFIQEPYFLHPMQFALDYPIAFGTIGLSGLVKEIDFFKKSMLAQFVSGATFAVVLRYLSHVISGIFIFGSGDPQNYSAVAWSFLYNTFALVDFAIALVGGVLLFSSKAFVKLMNSAVAEPNNNLQPASKEE